MKNKIASEKETKIALDLLSITQEFLKQEHISESSKDGQLIVKFTDFILNKHQC